MSFWDEATPISPANLNSSTVPVGGIIMYSGVIANLPANWSLCNGTGGTPDLRGRFVVGAEGAYTQGDTGGADTVTLTTSQIPAHTHASGSLATGTDGSHTHPLRAYKTTGSTSHIHDDTGRLAAGSDTGGATAQSTSAGGLHTHSVSGNTGSTGSGAAHENRPPYYALAYIMRVA